MAPFFTGTILLLDIEHYGIVFDHCWKFYPKSLVEIITVGMGMAFGKTD